MDVGFRTVFVSVFLALITLLSFASPNERTKEKAIFFQRLRRKKGPYAVGLRGASFGPIGKFYEASSRVLAFQGSGLGQPHLRPKRCPIMCWASWASVGLDFK